MVPTLNPLRIIDDVHIIQGSKVVSMVNLEGGGRCNLSLLDQYQYISLC